MKKLTAICLTLAVLLGSAGVTNAGWFGPSNYAECILDGMKGVTSDLAARAVAKLTPSLSTTFPF